MSDEGARVRLHASCVAFRRADDALPGAPDPFGVLLIGPSGAGKSTLALDLMALGAILVGDDRIELVVAAGALVARSPYMAASALIEARRIGLISAPSLPSAVVGLVVELGVGAADAPGGEVRLPPRRWRRFLGVEVPLASLPLGRAQASALATLARCGALVDPDAA